MQSKSVINQVIEKTVEKQNDSKKKTIQIVEKLNVPIRKCAHASIYFVLSILVMIFMTQVKNKKIWYLNIITILICFIYACTDEYHQTFVIGRTGKISDVLIDMIGVILGCLLFNLLYKKIRKNNHIDIAKNKS